MTSIVFQTVLALLAGITGWCAWHGHTTALQLLVLAAGAAYAGAGQLRGLTRPEWARAAAIFVAGAAVGALAYFGEISLLFWILAAGLFLWIEMQLRRWVAGALDLGLDGRRGIVSYATERLTHRRNTWVRGRAG